jgi:uncharacterized integral membrane protein
MERDRPREPHREPERASQPGRETARSAEPERTRQQQKDKPQRSEFEVKERKRRNALIARVVLGLILLVLFILFVSSNSLDVPVDFVFFETEASLVLVFLICALVGGVIAFLLGRSGRRANRKYIKELERRLEGQHGKHD